MRFLCEEWVKMNHKRTVTLADMKQHLSEIPLIVFREELVGGELFTLVFYQVSNPSLWDVPYALEARGIVFNSAGNCVCRPYEKFFNVGERESTLVHNILWSDNQWITDKLDGSMITPVLINGELYVKTKKSFYSDTAKSAQAYLDRLGPDSGVYKCCREWLELGYTPILEYITPYWKIVIPYEDEEFVITGVRNIATGETVVGDLTRGHDIRQAATQQLTKDEMFQLVNTAKGIEGWVIYDRNTGERYKIKTHWYQSLHHVMTDLRERDIARMVFDGLVDDLKATISAAGLSIAPTEAIENRVAAMVTEMDTQTKALVAEWQNLTNKEIALSDRRKHPLFGFVMAVRAGCTPDYIKYCLQNRIREFSLKTVYGNFQR